MRNKLNLGFQDVTFPWFDPTVHSWFKNKWDEPEAEESVSLGVDIKNEFDNLYSQKLSLQTLLDTSPYTNLIALLKKLRGRGVPDNMVERLFREIRTELCTSAAISSPFNGSSYEVPEWYDDFYDKGCIPLKVEENDFSSVMDHMAVDLQKLLEQGNVWQGAGYDNEKRYKRDVDGQLYSDLEIIFQKYGVMGAAEKYFNHSMVLDGVTLHVCKPSDQHWKMTMADQTPTQFENMHFDPKTGMLKCIFYLNDVTREDGPFSYIEGSHMWKDELFNRVVAKSVSVSNYLENEEKRNHFLRLPRNMQKCANIGAFLQDDVNELFTKLKIYTSDTANLMFFDPGGVHRGGIVQGDFVRINLQIMFRLSNNGQSLPFI
jgi:hypothetical protein